MAGHNGGPSGLSGTQRLLAEYEGNAVLLPHPSVAGNAVLIQDGADVPAELYWMLPASMEVRSDWPN
jgi:hypothetical protein